MEVDSDMHRKHHPGWCEKQKQDNVVVAKKFNHPLSFNFFFFETREETLIARTFVQLKNN
jgi:hypothetical protein